MRKQTIKTITVPPWIYKAVQVLRPSERLPVSVWAEKKRRLTGGAMPGPWRNRVTPYLVEIMDAFSDDVIEEIIFVKPTQVGGTTAMENMIGALVDQDPGPTLVVYPSDDLAETTAETRLVPMFKSCRDIAGKYRESESKKLQLKFRDMYLYLTGANSPADLSSKPIKNLFLDEVDKFPGASKREADPVSLAKERTKTFFNRKIFMASTPTLKTGLIWRAKEQADVEKHYFVPCLHCGKYIELKFAQIRWPDKEETPDINERAEKAHYVCQECTGVITDKDKRRMLEAGEWRSVRQRTETARSVAFWMNTLYSPFTRFSEIAREFIQSKDDPELLQNFTNSWLAEPWEDSRLKTSADMVLERQTDVPELTVPKWAKLLTAGVDVQQNCLYWTIRAWGDGVTSQNIAHGQASGFGEVERIMNLQYPREDGGAPMLVELALIDSGNDTDAVYDFCANNAEWALPCKGASNPMRSSVSRSRVNKTSSSAYGMNLILVDGGKYKDAIAGRLRRKNGPGSWMVYAGCDREYAEQVTAEHKVNVRNGRRVRQEWVPKTSHAANHYLDCEVYAFAAADMKNVRYLGLEDRREQPAKEPPVPPAAPEEHWIQQNEGWLNIAKEGGW
ncbi:MAG: phage terminase large subunit family protein [Clostridiaceae bacterium]|nr:phage terminase large subunit family protein [Clostridiaceae bacterium]